MSKLKKRKAKYFVPVTPAGTPVLYGAGTLMGREMSSDTKQGAIRNLLLDAAHMPYEGWEEFEERGYTIGEFEDLDK